MTTLRQIEANRRNARRSTGPVTEEGKQRSRCNAVRHGLTAETVIGALEDADDYQAFEAAVIADYDAQTAVERELVLRLASLLWRLRRATAMETGLFEIQARHLLAFRHGREVPKGLDRISHRLSGLSDPDQQNAGTGPTEVTTSCGDAGAALDLTRCFLRLASLPTLPLDRLSRYEAALWRQSAQTIFALNDLHRRTPLERRRRSRSTRLEHWHAQVDDD
jgi:hypothetical protein